MSVIQFVPKEKSPLSGKAVDLPVRPFYNRIQPFTPMWYFQMWGLSVALLNSAMVEMSKQNPFIPKD